MAIKFKKRLIKWTNKLKVIVKENRAVFNFQKIKKTKLWKKSMANKILMHQTTYKKLWIIQYNLI